MEESKKYNKPESPTIVHNESREVVETRRIERFIEFVREANTTEDAFRLVPSIMQRDQLLKLIPILQVEHPEEIEQTQKTIDAVDVEKVKEQWFPVLDKIRNAPDVELARRELGTLEDEIKTFDFIIIRPMGMLGNQTNRQMAVLTVKY